MIENRQLYSFDDDEKDLPPIVVPDENEANPQNSFPLRLISHIITSFICLILVLILCETKLSGASWVRTKLHTAINASTEDTFGYLSNTQFIKNVVKNSGNLIHLEEITKNSTSKLFFPGLRAGDTFNFTIWPVQGRISQNFGWQENSNNNGRQFNQGIEFTTDQNTAVAAITDGEVISITENPKDGATIILGHGNGWISTYRLLDRIQVRVGQAVKEGGMMARTFGNKVILEIRHDDEPVDPLTVIRNPDL